MGRVTNCIRCSSQKTSSSLNGLKLDALGKRYKDLLRSHNEATDSEYDQNVARVLLVGNFSASECKEVGVSYQSMLL